MRQKEELATDELRSEDEDFIASKLIAAMEGMLQMSEAQARSITAITDAISEIRYALERQGSVVNDMKNSLAELKIDRLDEPVLSEIHMKLKNLSDSWNIIASANVNLEDRITRWEAKISNINEDVAALSERFGGDLRQLKMGLSESMERDTAVQDGLSRLEARSEGLNERLVEIFDRLENSDLGERISAAHASAQRASEAAEELREIAETNKQAIRSVRERIEGNAAMIETNRKAIEAMSAGIQDAVDHTSASVNKIESVVERTEESLKKRIDYTFTSVNEKMDTSIQYISTKINEMQEAFQNAEMQNFDEQERTTAAVRELQSKLENIEMMLIEMKPKPRAPRKSAARKRSAARPTGAVVDYAAIEELIVAYVRENGRVTIDAIKGHTGIGETTLRKILHGMVRKGQIASQRQGKFVYYSAR